MARRAIGAVLAGAAIWSAPAAAQRVPAGGVELSSQDVRRGLGWSGGRASASADLSVAEGALDASLRTSATRGAPRHGGADAVADLMLGVDHDLGPVRVRAYMTGHLFSGARGSMDYVEAGGSASYRYGPLQVTGGTTFAPSQDSLGGSNLYLYAAADAGIPGTPYAIAAGIGRSSGRVDDPSRAGRLRPGGRYVDWRLGIERRRDRLTLGIDYIGTDIGRDTAAGPLPRDDRGGDRVVGRIGLFF